MIQAALHGKIGELEGKEDILTSVIFGRLRYIEPVKCLVPFLETAMLYDSHKTTLGNYFKYRNQNLTEYRAVKYYFWPRHTKWGEPDLVLIFSNHAGGAQDLLLLIECKLRSSKSSHGLDDQLKKYYLAINKHLDQFTTDEISRFRGEIGPIIYLTEMEAFSEIEESTFEIEKQVIQLKHPIFHLRWQNLHLLCETICRCVDNSVFKSSIFSDLSQYLHALNLVHFSGITAPLESILRISTGISPVFFKTKTAATRSCSYFKNLPTIPLDKSKICFFGGNL